MKEYSSVIFYTLPIFDCEMLNEWVKTQRPGYENYGVINDWTVLQNKLAPKDKYWSMVIDAGAKIAPHNLVFKIFNSASKLFVVLPTNFFEFCIVDTIRLLNKRDAALIPKSNYTSPYMYLLYEQMFLRGYEPEFKTNITTLIELTKNTNITIVLPPDNKHITSMYLSYNWSKDVVVNAFKTKYEDEFNTKHESLINEWNDFTKDVEALSSKHFTDVLIRKQS